MHLLVQLVINSAAMSQRGSLEDTAQNPISSAKKYYGQGEDALCLFPTPIKDAIFSPPFLTNPLRFENSSPCISSLFPQEPNSHNCFQPHLFSQQQKYQMKSWQPCFSAAGTLCIFEEELKITHLFHSCSLQKGRVTESKTFLLSSLIIWHLPFLPLQRGRI